MSFFITIILSIIGDFKKHNGLNFGAMLESIIGSKKSIICLGLPMTAGSNDEFSDLGEELEELEETKHNKDNGVKEE